MNKLITLLTLLALTLPLSVLAQPDDGPRERPNRERGEQRDRQSDRPRPSDREGERPDRREAIPVDQIEEAIATVRAMHGDADLPWLERIEAQLKNNPEEAAKRLSRFPRLRELMDTRKNRPAEFKLHATQSQLMRQVFPIVRGIRQAIKDEDQDKVDELRGQLRERFEELFEIRLKLKEIEIERIRQHLTDAEKELAGIKADSDKLIEEKINEIIERGGQRGPREDEGRPERDERRPKPDRGDRE